MFSIAEEIATHVGQDPTWVPRLLVKLDGYPDESVCWVWSGWTTPDGYGYTRVPGTRTSVGVHRVVWTAFKGAIPSGMVIDHDNEPHGCHNRACANPAHLSVVSRRHNTVVSSSGGASKRNAAVGACPQGHPYTDDNLVEAAVRRNGGRNCKTCGRERALSLARTVAAAARKLGMTQQAYRVSYGGSRAVAEAFLNDDVALGGCQLDT